jgi:flagellar hook-associated protein 1
MQSAFSGIELGKRSLVAHTQALQTAGHNLANVATEGYSRQRVALQPFDPIYFPGLNREETAGQVGQGVSAERIERIRDVLLEGRIVAKANDQGFWDVRSKYMLMVEQVYNEPTENSVRSLLDRFWDSWQELSVFPGENAARKAVLQRGQALIDGIHDKHRSLATIRDTLELDVVTTVDRINSILTDLSELNRQILKIQAVGDSPNDLLDRRDLLVKDLSSIINITVDSRDPDEFLIHTGGKHLLQGNEVHELVAFADPENDGYSEVRWAGTEESVRLEGGQLAGLVEMRDGDLRGEIQKLDTMTVNFIDLVNEVHREAFGANGESGVDFFVEYPFVNNVLGNYDRDGDGAFDSTYLFRINGANTLDAEEQIGLRGTMSLSGARANVDIEYFPTDTVGDIVSRINNASTEVVARLDRNGRLLLKATTAEEIGNPDFVLRHIEDSGQFLVGYAGMLLESGGDGAYDWEQADAVLSLRGGDAGFAVAPLAHPSAWIGVNPEIIRRPEAVAAGFGENGRAAAAGDGRAALAVASLRNTPVMIGTLTSFDEFFADVVADAGLRGEIAERSLETENLIMKELEDMRSAVSGVNIDEELAQMIKFQHGYAAAARFVSEITDMLDTIINRMGV